MLAALCGAAIALSSADLLSLCKTELGPNRFLCGPSAAASIEAAASALIEESARPAFPRDLMTLDGEWRLAYSSAFAAPFAPPQSVQSLLPLSAIESALPLVPRSVSQRIDVAGRRVVNVGNVAPWPAGFGPLAAVPGLGPALEELQASSVTLELDHAFSVDGEGGSGESALARGADWD